MKITGEEITGEEMEEDNDYGFFCDIDIESNYNNQYIENRFHIKKKVNIQRQKIKYLPKKEKDKISSFVITIYILSSFVIISLCFVI